MVVEQDISIVSKYPLTIYLSGQRENNHFTLG